jgi:hypothetical protein
MYCPDSQEGYFIDIIRRADRIFFTDEGELVLLLPYDSGSIIFKKS